MDFVSTLLSLFTQIPFLAELLLFFITSVPFVIVKQKRDPAYNLPQGLVRLLAVCILLVGGLKIGLSQVYGQGLPLWMGITAVVISAVVFRMSVWNFRFRVFAALCGATMLYVGALATFSAVSHTQTYSVNWEMTSPPGGQLSLDSPDYVVFTFRDHPDYFDYIYSDRLSTHLMIGRKPKIDLLVQLRYHWGLFAGHSILAVDGVPFTPSQQDGAGVTGNAHSDSPFPKYYLGLGN